MYAPNSQKWRSELWVLSSQRMMRPEVDLKRRLGRYHQYVMRALSAHARSLVSSSIALFERGRNTPLRCMDLGVSAYVAARWMKDDLTLVVGQPFLVAISEENPGWRIHRSRVVGNKKCQSMADTADNTRRYWLLGVEAFMNWTRTRSQRDPCPRWVMLW